MQHVDDHLLDKAIGGDRDALAQLLERHGPPVRDEIARGIPRRWRALLSADDIMQQTYTDAFLAIRRFTNQGLGAFAGWVATLAKRNLLDGLKLLEAQKRGGKLRAVHPTAQETSIVALYELIGGSDTTPSQKASRNEIHDALNEAIERLPSTYRQVVRMYDLEGQPVDAVAASLNRSVGAVYMLRARAHEQLAGDLGSASRYFIDRP